METMSYKTFVWPGNPHTYREEWNREPEYTTVEGTAVFQGMGPLKGTVRGSGAFFGAQAYENFRALMELAKEAAPGELRHPLWGIRTAYLTKLELVQEPKENYVGYSFTFTCADSDGEVPK